jgi:hypothetical protein
MSVLGALIVVCLVAAAISIGCSTYAVRLYRRNRQIAQRRARAIERAADAPRRYYLSEATARASVESFLARLESVGPSEKLQAAIDDVRADIAASEWWKVSP